MISVDESGRGLERPYGREKTVVESLTNIGNLGRLSYLKRGWYFQGNESMFVQVPREDCMN